MHFMTITNIPALPNFQMFFFNQVKTSNIHFFIDFIAPFASLCRTGLST